MRETGTLQELGHDRKAHRANGGLFVKWRPLVRAANKIEQLKYKPARPRAQGRGKSAAAINYTKLAKLVRLLGSDKTGEVVAAAAAIRRTLEAGGSSVHAPAAAIEAMPAGRPAGRQPRVGWGLPEPYPSNWEAMAWYCHFHRHRLRESQRQRVADLLLGRAFSDNDDRCASWHLQELRCLVAAVQAACHG